MKNNFLLALQSAHQRQWKGDCQVQNRTNMDKIFHKKSCRLQLTLAHHSDTIFLTNQRTTIFLIVGESQKHSLLTCFLAKTSVLSLYQMKTETHRRYSLWHQLSKT